MAGRIRDEDVAEVRARSPVKDVIGEYVELRPAGGGSLKGLCPFHGERTPSFNVTPDRGLWHCFSCHAGGDVITFVEDIENLSFTEAVEWLAGRARVELRYEHDSAAPGRDRGQRRRLAEAHRVAAGFYAARLLDAPDAAPARAYLSGRGISVADARLLGAGHSPPAPDALARHLRGLGFSDDELTRSGLARRGPDGLADMFRGRLMWPVRDVAGETIAFGASRLGQDDDGPEYLTTPETPLFSPGQALYGADLARRESGRARQVVIARDYADVAACHLAGVATAVAACGVPFSEGHVKAARRLIPDAEGPGGEAILILSGAGLAAALRAFGAEDRLRPWATAHPGGLGPCDLRARHGDAAVRDLIARRVPLAEFAIRAALARHDLRTAQGQLAALRDAAPVVARISDPALRQRYAASLSRWLGMAGQQVVARQVRDAAPARRASTAGGPAAPRDGRGRAGGSR